MYAYPYSEYFISVHVTYAPHIYAEQKPVNTLRVKAMCNNLA